MPRYHFAGDDRFLRDALAARELPAHVGPNDLRRGQALKRIANIVSNAGQIDDVDAQEDALLSCLPLLDELRAALEAAENMISYAMDQAGVLGTQDR